MSPPPVDPVARQREYYERTAGAYDGMHDAWEHDLALGHVIGFVNWLGARSLLDTGCGTGRAMRVVGGAVPELDARGNDPSRELLNTATTRFGVPAERLDCVSSESLPYPAGAFDVVVATSIMHHVPHPKLIIENMLRVARQAVFISDCNMYGQGSVAARLGKRALGKTALLGRVNRLRRGGNDWYYTDGDGIGWDYSVFDSVRQVREKCAEVLVIPTTGRTDVRSSANPMFWSSHALLCGFKAPLPRPGAET